jgi:hypothetical protein
MLKRLLFLIPLCAMIVAQDFNIETGLISEFSTSKLECVKKLAPVLSLLPVDDQRSLYASMSTSTTNGRCFDPDVYKKTVAEKLKAFNKVIASNVGNKSNSMIKSFGCIADVAQDSLNEEYVNYVNGYLTSLTPYGSYPMYTRCLATFIQNTNYVLRTRFRYLVTSTTNWDSVSMLDESGNIKGFSWKTSERDIIVNEFSRLEMCINNFETSALGIWEYVKLYFANSKECGVNPGSYQTQLFGYPVDLVQPDEPATEPTTSPGEKPLPTQKTDPNTAVSSVNTASVAPSGPTSITPTPPLQTTTSGGSSGSTTGSAGTGTANSSDSKMATSMIVDPNPNGGMSYDPCFDWSTYNGGTLSPPIPDAGAPSSSMSSSPEMSSKMIAAPMYSDEYYKDQIENKKFCPNLIGKDLTEWENTVYSYALYKDILDAVPSVTTYINDAYNCINGKSSGAEILKYLKDDYSKAYVNRNLINDMKYQINDKSSQDYAKILNLDASIKRLGLSYATSDFNLVCSNQTCKCLDCPTPINFTFNYSRFDYYTPGAVEGGKLEEDMYKPSPPTAFNIYISKCDNKIIYFLIENEQYSSTPMIDIKILHPSIPTTGLTSIVDLQNLGIQQCMIQDLKNTSSQCSNNTFKGINATCKSKFSNKCANLSNTVSQFSPDRVGFRACDITSVNVMDGSSYETFKKTCFEWINNNLIDGSLSLNLNALTNILTVIKNGQNPRSLRFLQQQVSNGYYKIVNSDGVDTDKAANVSAEASTGSNGTLDVDGSSYSAFYGGIMYAKGGDAAADMHGGTAMAAMAPTASMENTSSANAQKIPRDVGPPRLSSSSWMTLSCFVYIIIVAFLF